MCVLEGLLATDPSKRLTLGEHDFDIERRTVWDEPWMRVDEDEDD